MTNQIQITFSKVADLRLDTLDSWVFIDRFVFLPTPDGSGLDSSDAAQLASIKKDYGVVEFEVEYDSLTYHLAAP